MRISDTLNDGSFESDVKTFSSTRTYSVVALSVRGNFSPCRDFAIFDAIFEELIQEELSVVVNPIFCRSQMSKVPKSRPNICIDDDPVAGPLFGLNVDALEFDRYDLVCHSRSISPNVKLIFIVNAALECVLQQILLLDVHMVSWQVVPPNFILEEMTVVE